MFTFFSTRHRCSATQVQRTCEGYRQELQHRGSLFDVPATVRTNGLVISIATRNGGRSTNDDAALLWLPTHPQSVLWAAAIADGVTCSFESALGSQLACHAGLLTICRHEARRTPVSRPTDPCAKLFRKLGDRINRSAEVYRPEGCSKSDWQRYLRDGRLFQTTLMLAWQVDQAIHFCSIGDGGILLEYESYSAPTIYLPRSDRPVSCLGINATPAAEDFSMQTSTWQHFLAFTDGATPAIGHAPATALELVKRNSQRTNAHPASRVLQFLDRSDRTHDNLTLLTVSKGGTA